MTAAWTGFTTTANLDPTFLASAKQHGALLSTIVKYLVRTHQHHLVYQRTFDVLSDELTALLA
ncbi:hypothetical protein EDF64_11413 [Curtobacterium flaccumfaciens]|uniref:Uncharacterized protein n=1 Tax=Curtobacterium flaccumfaciens TaxID=2035 RepID=A0A4R6DCR8_9MICO|nr:hypothetical protein [Curtobacterium flaccumfaciens]TDN41934.1 hypothetical protein EDF64_11413 [Curtobacterium flaccumfaciens]